MKLSIIIPCFNEENTIKIIIEKVLKFSLFDKEIIIVDDCSTDQSREIIKKLAKAHHRYFWHKNAGYGTKDHLRALKKFGVTKYHRKKFKPIHNILSLEK